jgi:hypothetical protein
MVNPRRAGNKTLRSMPRATLQAERDVTTCRDRRKINDLARGSSPRWGKMPHVSGRLKTTFRRSNLFRTSQELGRRELLARCAVRIWLLRQNSEITCISFHIRRAKARSIHQIIRRFPVVVAIGTPLAYLIPPHREAGNTTPWASGAASLPPVCRPRSHRSSLGAPRPRQILYSRRQKPPPHSMVHEVNELFIQQHLG